MDQAVADAMLELARISRHGIVVQDSTGAVVWHNDTSDTLLGVRVDETASTAGLTRLGTLTDVDGTPLDIRSIPARAAFEDGAVHTETVVGVHAGEMQVSRWLEISTRRIITGDESDFHVISSLTDVSDQFEAAGATAAALRAFRRSLVPAAIAHPERFELAARSRPATGTLIGGGDFYDVVELGDGAVAFFVGDMEGHGIGPATDTLLARHTLRAAALHADDPAAALGWLHQALTASSTQRSCAAAFGVAGAHPDGVEVRFSLAGHPLPLLVDDEGGASFVGTGGQLVGTMGGEEAPINHLVLSPGSALVFYTDGLTDARSPRLTDDELVAAATWQPTADRLVDSLINVDVSSDATFSDDTALLAILVPRTPT